MKFLDLGQSATEQSESRISKLTEQLGEAERKLAERELWVAEALDQTEVTRAQYEQANARAETLRRHLNAKEEQLSALHQQLRQRDDRIATLERLAAKAVPANTAASDNKPSGEIKQPSSDASVEYIAAMKLALEPLEQPGTLYRIAKASTSIGRNVANDISIDSNSVSRFHARLDVEVDGVFLVDLESTNGCKVNDKRITREALGDGDAVSIGSVKFKFSASPSAELEARGMQETHVLLDDSVILIPPTKDSTKVVQ